MKPEKPLLNTLESLAFRPVRDLDSERDRFLSRLEQARLTQETFNHLNPPGTATDKPVLRPLDGRGQPGGLINLDPRLSTLILPDLHTRRRGFFQILSSTWASSTKTVLQLLEEGRLNLVCVGDALHSEGPGGPGCWRTAWVEYLGGFRPSPEMDREMNAGLALLEMIFLLQTEVPRNFFFLKGNHENITCEEGRGNHPFGKYAAEGEMVFGYLERRFGKDMVKDLYHWEHSLPLMARGPWYLVSHAEPRRVFSPEEVIDDARRPEVVDGLTWTRRWDAETGAVRGTLERFLPPWFVSRTLYWAGHTPQAEPSWYEEENLVLFHGSGPLKGWILPPELPDRMDSGDIKGRFQSVSAEEGSDS